MTNFEVTSPCINLCKIDEPSQLCTGCYRSLDEITLWSTMNTDAKLAVINDLARRKKSLISAAESNK